MVFTKKTQLAFFPRRISRASISQKYHGPISELVFAKSTEFHSIQSKFTLAEWSVIMCSETALTKLRKLSPEVLVAGT